MATFKQFFNCCNPDIICEETKISLEKDELNENHKTTVIFKRDANSIIDKSHKEIETKKKNNGCVLKTQGTAIFNSSTQAKNNANQTKLNPQIEPLPTNRLITPEDIENSPMITIEDILDKNIFNNNKRDILINAGGLASGGVREEKDGVVFFSLHKSSPKINTLFIPDVQLYNIQLPKEEDNPSLNPYLFVVYYVKKTNRYHIKFSERKIISTHVFIKLSNQIEIPIRHNEILSLGPIVVNLCPMKDGQLEISFMNNTLDIKTFSPEDKKITIGRGKTCSIPFHIHKGFSKVQSTLKYNDDEGCWFLRDGSETKSSTNGTWLFALNSYPISNDMLIEFYGNQLKIKC